VNPSLQKHVSVAEQVPFPEQTEESDEFLPKQTLFAQFPIKSKLQMQWFGEIQVPFPEQTVESEEFFP
jgi:hypothetical protein